MWKMPGCPRVRLIGTEMAERGKFIVLEGIDGSGKRTQLDMLARAFGHRGLPYERVSFPNYSGFFGKLVARFLNGEFGGLKDVDPHFSALLYAGDRLESKTALESTLAAGKILLADRYIPSNLAHQGARGPQEKRADFLQWLRELEYRVYGLPLEDLVIFLHVPADLAQHLVGKKSVREYTAETRDIQEADRAHLEAAAAVYQELARQANWSTVECLDPATSKMRTPAAIHDEILSVIAARVATPARAAR